MTGNKVALTLGSQKEDNLPTVEDFIMEASAEELHWDAEKVASDEERARLMDIVKEAEVVDAEWTAVLEELCSAEGPPSPERRKELRTTEDSLLFRHAYIRGRYFEARFGG